ncbi:MAG: hypothetical protein VXZ35_02915 [Pseudomonadota bacterium]|nr:hypothetical protein [Pseudomonadota bacterium]
MEIAGNVGGSLQDNVRQAERSPNQLRDERQQNTATVNTSRPVEPSAPPTGAEAPQPATRSDDAGARGQRYPSDPDRVTLSQTALQTERRERDDSSGSVIDNDTGEVVSERSEPPQQNRSAIDAYGAIQNIT